MKGRLPLFVILGSSLTFLASLYLSWVGPTTDPIKRLLSSGQGATGALSLLNLFSRSAYYHFPTDGWTSFGQAAAITAVALALCALVSLVRPEREALLPFGGCAIALVTLTLVRDGGGTEMTLHVQLPASLPDDGVPGWWPMVRGGWQDTVDRLAAATERAAVR